MDAAKARQSLMERCSKDLGSLEVQPAKSSATGGGAGTSAGAKGAAKSNKMTTIATGITPKSGLSLKLKLSLKSPTGSTAGSNVASPSVASPTSGKLKIKLKPFGGGGCGVAPGAAGAVEDDPQTVAASMHVPETATNPSKKERENAGTLVAKAATDQASAPNDLGRSAPDHPRRPRVTIHPIRPISSRPASPRSQPPPSQPNRPTRTRSTTPSPIPRPQHANASTSTTPTSANRCSQKAPRLWA